MSKIKLELECEISKDQNSAYLAGTKVKVAEFVETGEPELQCDKCITGFGQYTCCIIPCQWKPRTDSRNGHWVACEGDSASEVIEAARCIRHWHDTHNNGMIVSAYHVMELWKALERYDSTQEPASTGERGEI